MLAHASYWLQAYSKKNPPKQNRKIVKTVISFPYRNVAYPVKMVLS